MKKEYFENILKRLEIKFEEVEVVKNNNTIMKGYTLGETNLRPTVYTDQIDEFDDEVEVVKFLEGIMVKTKNIDNIFIKERFENAVLMGVRNKEWNSKDENTFTFDIKDFEDLEGYYYLRISPEDSLALGIIHTLEEDGTATAVVTKPLMKTMGIDENWLKLHAEKAMFNEMTLKGITDTLLELTGEECPFFDDDIDYYREHEQMWVISNKEKHRGAGVIASDLCREKIFEFAIKNEISKFAILPSSIHEVLFVKLEESMEEEVLNNMVSEINTEQVKPRERLSNHSYIFNI